MYASRRMSSSRQSPEVLLAQTTPAGYAYLTSEKKWIPRKHLILISDAVLDALSGAEPRVLITLPPRHGKSEFVSKYVPAWITGRFPDKRVILTSYEAEFAASWGRKAKEIFEKWNEQLFNVRLKQGSAAAHRWEVKNHDGGMTTAGAGGPITGKGADFFIIDDPYKNAEEARSKTIREKIWDWYTSTAYTRLEPGGALFVIHTRWHEEDLGGRLISEMKEGGERWKVINLPAIAEEDDPLNRQPGEALWPERYNLDALARIKQTLGSYWWAALYQQRPQPEGGGLFKKSYFKYFKEDSLYYVLQQPDGVVKHIEKNRCYIFQMVDVAATAKERSDYFVVGTFAVTPYKDLLVLDIFREKVETTMHKKVMWQQYYRWRPLFQGVENRTFGLNIIQDAAKEGLPVRAILTEGDKVAKALPVVARYELGTVYHREGALWLPDLENELVIFNSGKHDDQVDVIAMAGIEVIGQAQLGIMFGGNAASVNLNKRIMTVNPGNQGTLQWR